jgi:flagellar hook-associated protein 1 FlgK
MSLGSIFDISTRSLGVYQSALEVASNNIANSANPDYSRQQVNLTTETPNVAGGFVWGAGIKIEDITRVRDSFTDNQIRSNNPQNSESSNRSELMGQIEDSFSEPSDSGISTLMNNFFNSWQQLAVTPNSTALRQNVLSSAESLSNQVSSVYSSLTQTRSDIMTDLKTKVGTLNDDLKQVQQLNAQIFQFTSAGQSPNDLLDQRDKVIDDLSKMGNITVSYDNNNSATISIGGVFACDKENANQFSVSDNNGQATIVSKNNVSAVLNSGDLFADTDIYSNEIPNDLATLDQVFSTFTSQVNAVHQSGTNIENPPGTNINFFDSYNNGVLKINPAIVADTNKIAVSSDGTSGNGDIAARIADLSSQPLINGQTLQDTYSSLVSQIGTKKQSADQSVTATSLIQQQLATQKSSYSGVSVDEEMSNILMYQRSYEASAKLVQVANECLQTLLTTVT